MSRFRFSSPRFLAFSIPLLFATATLVGPLPAAAECTKPLLTGVCGDEETAVGDLPALNEADPQLDTWVKRTRSGATAEFATPAVSGATAQPVRLQTTSSISSKVEIVLVSERFGSFDQPAPSFSYSWMREAGAGTTARPQLKIGLWKSATEFVSTLVYDPADQGTTPADGVWHDSQVDTGTGKLYSTADGWARHLTLAQWQAEYPEASIGHIAIGIGSNNRNMTAWVSRVEINTQDASLPVPAYGLDFRFSGDSTTEECDYRTDCGAEVPGCAQDCTWSVATPYDLSAVGVWPNAPHGGLVRARGAGPEAIPGPVGGDEVSVAIKFGDGQEASLTFAASDCRTHRHGGWVCRDLATRSLRQRVIVRPRTGGGSSMKLYLGGIDLDSPIAGPVEIAMDVGGERYVGEAESCRGGTPPRVRMICD